MSSAPARPVVGIFGAGKVGIAIARLALAAGYTVHIATSGSASDTAQITRYFAPGAIPADSHDIVGLADVVVLAVPLHRFRTLPLLDLDRHIVVDVMNYWPPINGTLAEFEDGRPTTEVVRAALPDTARVVKTFNHLGYHQIEELAHKRGEPERTALAISGDDRLAMGVVSTLIDDLGFDPVEAGGLSSSNILEAESAIFGQALTAPELRMALDTIGSERAA